jgi:hypothetical protein
MKALEYATPRHGWTVVLFALFDADVLIHSQSLKIRKVALIS